MNFSCHLCGKKYKKFNLLKSHVRTHPTITTRQTQKNEKKVKTQDVKLNNKINKQKLEVIKDIVRSVTIKQDLKSTEIKTLDKVKIENKKNSNHEIIRFMKDFPILLYGNYFHYDRYNYNSC